MKFQVERESITICITVHNGYHDYFIQHQTNYMSQFCSRCSFVVLSDFSDWMTLNDYSHRDGVQADHCGQDNLRH